MKRASNIKADLHLLSLAPLLAYCTLVMGKREEVHTVASLYVCHINVQNFGKFSHEKLF